MLKRYFIPLLLILAALAVAVYFFAGRSHGPRDPRAAVPVEKFQLNNGLTVIVMPNDRIPVVTHLLIVKAGGADDPEGKTGLAHYLEHLMFTGTKNYPEGVYDHAIAKVGGLQNAFTTHDYTLFYATVAKEHLPMVMTMEADRLMNLEFEPVRAARELKIITEERNMRVDNSASAQWEEQLNALTFLNHPYHHPVIGWAEDMATFTPDDAKQFFHEHYRASNMMLVVAGDVTPRDVRRYAQRYYGALPGGEVAARNWPKEPPVRMARHGEMHDSRVNEPRLLRQYVAPSSMTGNTKQAMPLAVFAQYLGGGDTSVLYNALVREQHLAINVNAEYDAMTIGPSLFRIVATPAPGVTMAQLEAALDATLARVLATPLDAAAMARSRTALSAEVIYAQDGLQQLANTMAALYAIGLDEGYFYDWSKTIEGVKDEEALAAAQAVIVPKGAVTGYLLPEEKAAAVAPVPAGSPAPINPVNDAVNTPASSTSAPLTAPASPTTSGSTSTNAPVTAAPITPAAPVTEAPHAK